MSTGNIPENQVTQADFDAWVDMSKKLAALKASEMLLRMKIFNSCFPEAKEGTNKMDLGGGWQLTATYPVDRKIDVAALTTLAPHLRNDLAINLDMLIKQEPKLSVSIYRALTDEQRKEFDQVLIVKPGSPQMKLEQPKRKEAAGFVEPQTATEQ